VHQFFKLELSALTERSAAIDAIDRLAALQSICLKFNIQIESGCAQRIPERRL
jgi:hypothetical protein